MVLTETFVRIVLAIITLLVGLGIGLLLRRFLLRWLQKTVLDDWLSQTLGFIIVIPPLAAAAVGAFWIYTNRIDVLGSISGKLTQGVDVKGIVLNFVGSILIIVFAIGVARTFSKIAVRSFGEKRVDLNMRIIIHRVSYIVVMIIAIFWILSLWQVAIALPVTVLGTLTLAFTFSIQDILKDLVAGIYILIEHPFFIGDQISTADYTGEVTNVELRATHLRLVSGEDITIPNALVFGGVVINNSRYSERRATIIITLPLKDFSREQTSASILDCLRQIEGVLPKPEPVILISGIVDQQIELTLRFWLLNGQLATVTDVVYALRTLLPDANLSVKETAGNV